MTILAPQRHWHTAGELSARWRMSEERAEEILRGLQRTGYAEKRGEFWRATARACRLHRVLAEMGPG